MPRSKAFEPPRPERTPVTTVEQYLERLPAPSRAALEVLRLQIQELVPEATLGISYQLPSFKLHGMLVGFGATPHHCAFYVMSNTVLAPFLPELAGYSTATGTIRFQPEAPLPAALVARIVQARVAENLANQARKVAEREAKAASRRSGAR